MPFDFLDPAQSGMSDLMSLIQSPETAQKMQDLGVDQQKIDDLMAIDTTAEPVFSMQSDTEVANRAALTNSLQGITSVDEAWTAINSADISQSSGMFDTSTQDLKFEYLDSFYKQSGTPLIESIEDSNRVTAAIPTNMNSNQFKDYADHLYETGDFQSDGAYGANTRGFDDQGRLILDANRADGNLLGNIMSTGIPAVIAGSTGAAIGGLAGGGLLGGSLGGGTASALSGVIQDGSVDIGNTLTGALVGGTSGYLGGYSNEMGEGGLSLGSTIYGDPIGDASSNTPEIGDTPVNNGDTWHWERDPTSVSGWKVVANTADSIGGGGSQSSSETDTLPGGGILGGVPSGSPGGSQGGWEASGGMEAPWEGEQVDPNHATREDAQWTHVNPDGIIVAGNEQGEVWEVG
ncbi:MAG: hypothetical protein DRQ47_08955, partial [Gammaproteobacteria bacterium]